MCRLLINRALLIFFKKNGFYIAGKKRKYIFATPLKKGILKKFIKNSVVVWFGFRPVISPEVRQVRVPSVPLFYMKTLH